MKINISQCGRVSLHSRRRFASSSRRVQVSLVLVNKGEEEGTRDEGQIDVASAALGCSVVIIREMNRKADLSMKWSVSTPSWSWLFMGCDGKNPTINSPGWGEFAQNEWAHSQREQSQTPERLCEKRRRMLRWSRHHGCLQDVSKGDTGHGERITHPVNPWNALPAEEKLVWVFLLTSEAYERRKMEPNKTVKRSHFVWLFKMVAFKQHLNRNFSMCFNSSAEDVVCLTAVVAQDLIFLTLNLNQCV